MTPIGKSVLDLCSLSDGHLATKNLLSFGEQAPNMLRQEFYLLRTHLLLTSDPSR